MVSARWVWSRTSNRSAMAALSAMISLVTENGEQGAKAIWITAPSPRS
ncbi:hypothetical protein AHiyo1_39430 [Arthrobacter sp. Hiyo1]|nr:hypothetical protein AHiyo1_39430 [Arthrobacter sp. Hiyo1]